MPQFFIDRPNFAWVIAIAISLLGILALSGLGVAQYPNVAPPQISISATYPGASASVIDETVVSLLQEELNGAKNLVYYQSSSSGNGTAEIVATFKPGTNPDAAQVDVQNRIKRVEPRLPPPVIQQGISLEQASAGFFMILALSYPKDGTSDRKRDPVGLADYAARYVNNELRRLPGIGKVQMFSGERAMRVWVDPVKLNGYGLSVDDVNRAIAAQNVQIPGGGVASLPLSGERLFTAPILVSGQLTDADEFGKIVLRGNSGGALVRLSDVAQIELGSQSYIFEARLNGEPTVALGLQLAPNANALETAQVVRTKLAELSKNFPADIRYSVPYDTSRFVGAAIKKVVHTLIEAIILVFLVMILFLQNLRYTLIPTLVVPVCLLGTFAAMYALGFTINMMTMFGMVLAIGILVDDAIIVVESVERIMAEEGLSPKDATRKAMKQISGAIVGITAVLSAVFMPLALMPGAVGVIYKQFAMSLAVSIVLSGFLALSLTPALCATLLKPIAPGQHHARKGFYGWFNRRFDAVQGSYRNTSRKWVARAGQTMAVYLVLIAILAVGFIRLPSGFLPAEDQGYMMAEVMLPPGAAKSRTLEVVKNLETYMASRPAMENVITVDGWSFSGSGGQNTALAFPVLKDWSERPKSASVQAESMMANHALAGKGEGRVMVVMPPTIIGMGSAGGFSLRLQDKGGVGPVALREARDGLLGRAAASKVLSYAIVEGLEDVPQLRLLIDRDRAAAMGVSMTAIRDTLSTLYGSSQVNEFPNKGRMQRVMVQAAAESRMTPESLQQVFVTADGGSRVPLSDFTSLKWENGPAQMGRYNGYPSYSIMGDAAPGHSSGDAMAEMTRLLTDLPPGIGYEWTGLSYEERATGSQAPILLGLALLVVFLVLVALYESWRVPFSVLLIVPVGALGAVLALTLLNMPNDVYFKVGLVTIIGLAAKNAILIVEFAKALYDEGRSLNEAVLEAARLRFRPIIMTSMAFILGVLPLALASGAGAGSQQAIGVAVIGGMLGATFLGVFFVPVFFVWVMSRFGGRREAMVGPPVRRADSVELRDE